ncbi:MAG: glycosyltransferase [Candidatus Nanoarchaeia archaeon]|nr:glycosyltransferase [Candidatus Nanoarchaeia archaeon]MDD5358137.1 glycosyltransferase [Candidatus Nanoarchaeia archaeon]MDD5589324.1 glycosyltransferase [Candidatus Nanoarchaeia archaeon]
MKDKKLTEKDTCLLIATYNRAEDIEKTFDSLIKNKNIPGKVVIIDQSKNEETKLVVNKYKKRLPIDYIYCNIPSADISMNMGIKKYRDKFPILITSGDDVDFLENYLDEVIKEFNNNPKIMAIGGKDISSGNSYNFDSPGNKIKNLILRIFFLPFKENHKFRITGPYGHTSSPIINENIEVQWIPGVNTCWRSEIYKNYLWPEIKGYNVIDDIDSSYHVYKEYGKGSLMMIPKCRVYHRYSHAGRYDDKKRIFVNHEDHFSYFYMYFNNPLGKIKLFLSLAGIIIGNFLRFIFRPKKETFNGLVYNVQAIRYCLKNRKDIENKKYRLYLNEDLSMKKDIL